jgi:hypothetical protein
MTSEPKIYTVHGIAFVPVKVAMRVYADSEKEATECAESEFRKSDRKQDFIQPGPGNWDLAVDFKVQEIF